MRRRNQLRRNPNLMKSKEKLRKSIYVQRAIIISSYFILKTNINVYVVACVYFSNDYTLYEIKWQIRRMEDKGGVGKRLRVKIKFYLQNGRTAGNFIFAGQRKWLTTGVTWGHIFDFTETFPYRLYKI